MAVGEVALGAFLQVLFQMIALPVMELFTPLLGLNKQVKRLKDTLLMIHRQIQAADEEANKEWLDKLKDAAYDMEDILDEIKTQYLLLDVENRKQGGEPLLAKLAAVRSQDKKSGFLIYSAENVGRFFTRAVGRLGDRTKKKIQDALDKLEEAAKSRDTLGLGRNTADGGISANPTGGRIKTLPDRIDPVYGRRDDRQKLLEMIEEEASHSPSGVNYSVVTILGMGGIGKTALARLIYKDADRFTRKSWVCAPSIGSDSLVKLVGDILSQLPNSDNQHGGSNLRLVRLLTALKSCLKDNKFLIVIDDVWTVEKDAWKDLYAAFEHCGKGSKVVVTTQKEDVANMMGSTDLYRLQKMEDEHCCKLFKFEAFGHSDAQVKGTKVEEEIAKKCRGVPLVAEVLGTIFSCKNLHEISWKDISDADIWNTLDYIKMIFPRLQMCYYDLPSELKRCFEYFSLFPEDYVFNNQDNLVQMWLAEGFVLPKRVRSEQVEYYMNLGGNCYEELKKRSLLCDDGKMPELLHSLACYVAGNFYHKHDNHLIGLEGLHIGSPRHVSFLGKNIEETALDSLKGCMKLRTILVDSIPSNCLDRLLAWKILRVLELGNSGLSVLPPSIGELKHLRYLSLHSCIIASLPDTICSLCNLQTLDLRSCAKLTQLPNMIGDLVSLHHLNLRGTGLLSIPNSICGATKLQSLIILDCRKLTQMPPHLGNLTGLRDLSNYLVSAEADCGIRELNGLSHLKGPLTISGLEHVTVVDDAENADLNGKENLEEVTYVWSRNRQASDPLTGLPDENVLRALKPSGCRLKSLSIDGYGGNDFPEWLSEMINLKILRLDHCLNITSLPDHGLANLKSLRSLHIKNCSQFNIELQPLLNVVHNLKFLQQLEVESTYFDLTSTKLWIKENGAIRCLPRELHSLTSLQNLRITDCSQLQSLCECPLPTTHEELCRTDCQNVQPLQCAFLNLTSLRSLKITNCEQLRSVCEDELPATLIELRIQNCGYLQSLPQRLHNLTALQCLKVNGSRNMYPRFWSCVDAHP